MPDSTIRQALSNEEKMFVGVSEEIWGGMRLVTASREPRGSRRSVRTPCGSALQFQQDNYNNDPCSEV